jgi:hypothetical protein
LAVEQPRGRSLRARSSLIEFAALAGWNQCTPMTRPQMIVDEVIE